MLPALLPVLIAVALAATPEPAFAWEPVVLDCRGAVESQPVTYKVVVGTANMAHMAVCPRDEFGQQQRCATWAWSERDVGTATEYDFDSDPPVGMVFAVDRAVAFDPAGNRSDGPCL